MHTDNKSIMHFATDTHWDKNANAPQCTFLGTFGAVNVELEPHDEKLIFQTYLHQPWI